MKTILVPTEDNDAMDSVLATALALARRFNSYIEGFPLLHASGQVVAVEMTGGILLPIDPHERKRATDRCRHLFEDFMNQNKVPRAVNTTGSLSYGWLDQAPEGHGFVGSYARVFDVTVIARLNPAFDAVHNRAIESALFESGRPIVLSPPVSSSRIATNILVAWNRSMEQALATALALPILQKAERVTVISVVDGTEVPGPSVDRLVTYLHRNNIPAELRVIELEGRNTGEAILATAESLACDLLIKGAYAQSRMRQKIFGGTTQHIMENANLPVLLAK